MRRPALLGSMILALCAPAVVLADGGTHAKTLAGTLTANPSGSVTVTSSTATLTCTVPSREITSVAKLQLGIKVKIACHPGSNGALVLASLRRVTSHDTKGGGSTSTGSNQGGDTKPGGDSNQGGDTKPGGDSNQSGGPTGTTTHTGDGDNGSGSTTTTTTTTDPPKPPPSPPPAKTRDAVGIVFFLSSTGVAVRPDAGGDVLTCAITPAPDSTAAAAKLTLNGHFGIVCRLDGTHWVLSGATPVH
jgi:hypothetical protein